MIIVDYEYIRLIINIIPVNLVRYIQVLEDSLLSSQKAESAIPRIERFDSLFID